MKSLLVHARPFRLATMSRVDVRLGSAASAAALGLGGFTWESAIVRRPRMSIDLLNEELDGKVQAGKADLIINLAQIKNVPGVGELYWSGAPITIYDVDDLDLTTAPIEFTGIVEQAQPDLDADRITLNCQVSKSKLQRPVLGGQFDGGGGLGGDAGKRGVLKPAGYGFVRDVEPVWFDEVRNIGMLDGYGNLVDVSWLGEGASSFGPSVGDYPNYDALAAALDAHEVPEGRWATSFADGIVGLGGPPAGVITCDCQFGINRSGAWIRRLLEYHASLPTAEIDTASLAALDAAVNRPVHYWTSEQREVLDLVQAIAASCNATPLLTFQGMFGVTRLFGGTNVGTIDRQASSTLPRAKWTTAEPNPPIWRVTARAARPARVLSPDEVMYEDDLIDRGLFKLTETYRRGHMVWLADGSQWLYINAIPEAGHAPPAAPDTEDDWWFRIKPPTTAADLLYADGTPIEDLKPAVPGATKNLNRGAWAAGVAYDVGDFFEYLGSSYSVITAHTSSAGNPPPNSNVHVLAARGANAPVVLVQWSVNGSTGWHTDFADGDLYLRTSSDGGATWSAAALVVGEGSDGGTGNIKQIVFRRSAAPPSTPVGNGIPSGWSDGPPAADGNPLWMSVAEQTHAGVLVSSWSTPVQLTAYPLLVQWSVNGSTGWHSTFTTGDLYIRTSADNGATWSTAAKIVGEGTTGAPGNFFQYVFKRSASAPASPSGNGVPSGWSDGPPSGTDPLWMSVAEQTSSGILVSFWSTPARLDGAAGAPGAPGLTIAPIASIDVACFSDGTPKSGEFNKTRQIKVFQGSTDVTESCSFSRSDSNTTSSVSNSSGSRGLVTFTAISADTGYTVVSITFGTLTATVEIPIAKRKDATSPSASYPSVAIGGAPTITVNYPNAISVAPGQTLTVDIAVNTNVPSGVSGNVSAQVQISPSGASSWSVMTGGSGSSPFLDGEAASIFFSGTYTNSGSTTVVVDVRAVVTKTGGTITVQPSQSYMRPR